MSYIEGTKLTIEMTLAGEEKIRKQNFGDVIDNPDEADIQKLSTIMHGLAPENTLLVGSTKTEVIRYDLS